MTNEETAELVRLLKSLQSDDLLSPRMPLEVWKALHGVVPMPAVEVIVTRTGKDFLLTDRQDEYWNGWHIPGGFMLHKESIADACSRVAKRELNIDVTFKECIDAFMWPDHPYGSPLSLVCVCHTSEEPKVGQFFTEVPPNIIVHHDKFIQRFLEESKKEYIA